MGRGRKIHGILKKKESCKLSCLLQHHTCSICAKIMHACTTSKCILKTAQCCCCFLILLWLLCFVHEIFFFFFLKRDTFGKHYLRQSATPLTPQKGLCRCYLCCNLDLNSAQNIDSHLGQKGHQSFRVILTARVQ